MKQVPDWTRRKLEIGNAFRRSAHLPHETDEAAYRALLDQLGIETTQDMSIMISIVRDAVMGARREERPTVPLDTFLDWLESVR